MHRLDTYNYNILVGTAHSIEGIGAVYNLTLIEWAILIGENSIFTHNGCGYLNINQLY